MPSPLTTSTRSLCASARLAGALCSGRGGKGRPRGGQNDTESPRWTLCGRTTATNPPANSTLPIPISNKNVAQGAPAAPIRDHGRRADPERSWEALEPPRGLVKYRRGPPTTFQSHGSGVCVSNKFPDDAEAAGWGTHSANHSPKDTEGYAHARRDVGIAVDRKAACGQSSQSGEQERRWVTGHGPALLADVCRRARKDTAKSTGVQKTQSGRRPAGQRAQGPGGPAGALGLIHPPIRLRTWGRGCERWRGRRASTTRHARGPSTKKGKAVMWKRVNSRSSGSRES